MMITDTNLAIKSLKGKEILPYISDLANLRINIFRHYPYLYEGCLKYEEKYLKTYADSDESIMVIVLDANKVVGASTAIPLEFETKEFQQPFTKANIALSSVFYLGESVLQPSYRGKGIYRHFFEEREKAAHRYGATTTAFCAIKRDAKHPKKPSDYTPLDAIWQHFGYQKQELTTDLKYQEIGEQKPSHKLFEFWLKPLSPSNVKLR